MPIPTTKKSSKILTFILLVLTRRISAPLVALSLHNIWTRIDKYSLWCLSRQKKMPALILLVDGPLVALGLHKTWTFMDAYFLWYLSRQKKKVCFLLFSWLYHWSLSAQKKILLNLHVFSLMPIPPKKKELTLILLVHVPLVALGLQTLGFWSWCVFVCIWWWNDAIE